MSFIAQENEKNRHWLYVFGNADFHIRGCMIEWLAQELEIKGSTQEGRDRIIFLLQGIAARLK